MSKRLEAALAAEKKAAERRGALERRERLKALAKQISKSVHAEDDETAYDAASEMVGILANDANRAAQKASV